MATASETNLRTPPTLAATQYDAAKYDAAKYYNDTKTVAAKEATAGGKATLSLGHTKLINKEVRAV
jgi:hypothetical protein